APVLPTAVVKTLNRPARSTLFPYTTLFRSQGQFYLSETPDRSSYGWDAAAIRLCNWVLFNDRNTGRNFFVFNAHFDHIGQVARERSALLMQQRINFLTNGQPVLMTGDMRSEEHTSEL